MAVIHVLTWVLFFISASALMASLVDLKTALWFATVNFTILVITYYLNIYLVDKLLEKKQTWLYLLFFAVLLTTVVFVRVYFNRHFFLGTLQAAFHFNENWLYSFSIVTTLIVMVLSFFNGVLANRSEKEKEYQAAIARHGEARVEFLKAQMSPHFLFNTLHNIYALTLKQASLASEMILVLSEILRYVVYESRKDKVYLSDEIGQIKKLIHLYQLKSEESLPISIIASFSPAPFLIEPMVLIPLVENCFKHGNLHTDPNAFIAIQLVEENGGLTFETTNSRDAAPKVKLETGGIALNNIRERLAIRYPGTHQLEIKETANSFFVRLKIQNAHA